MKVFHLVLLLLYFSCKVVIYNYVFIGFYSIPNLIVIMFNFIYPVFHMGFICKDWVWEKESVKTQGKLKIEAVFTGSSRVSFLRSDACALHMTGMRRVRTGWRQLVFANVSQVKSSRETPTKHFVLPDCHFWYTLSLPILYIPPLPTYVEECF